MADYIKLLDDLYNNPKSPAAYSGIDSLWYEARKTFKHIPRNVIKDYLEGHRTYTLMRPKRVRFPRSRTIAAGFMTDVQVDLADLQALSRHNKGYRYLLVGIDVLSKRIFTVNLKSKKSDDMVESFRQLISQMPMKPHRIFSDKGTEFKNRQLKEYFEKEEIDKHEATHSSVKASLAERAIRNLKQRLYRYFSQNKTLKWIDIVQKIVYGINKSRCRVHGMRPIDINFENAQEIWQKMYGGIFSNKNKNSISKLSKGDFVRMSVGKGTFDKGYLPNWSDEILEVDKVKDQSTPLLYKLKDDKGEKFKGSFYSHELSKVRKDRETEYRIEKVYRKRKRADGTKELLVKFIGYPDREWISESQLV
uniref:Integrase catalytic domain-containing protein n=1 Tax=Meloidogyne enterolobii TaxID=390850 RepID=A0A6V7U119_MELEN|nr:unnamed protein product [Meloidogyne enterolobii]